MTKVNCLIPKEKALRRSLLALTVGSSTFSKRETKGNVIVSVLIATLQVPVSKMANGSRRGKKKM